jgi:hypothetical protein
MLGMRQHPLHRITRLQVYWKSSRQKMQRLENKDTGSEHAPGYYPQVH